MIDTSLLTSIIGYVILGLILGSMFVHYLNHSRGHARFSYIRYGLSLIAMCAVIYALAKIDAEYPNNLAYEFIPFGVAFLSCAVYVVIALKQLKS
jgi:O-antigen/teichoic acid export membrane protein